jgi:hypothetical protein
MVRVHPLAPGDEAEWDSFLRGTRGGLFAHTIAHRNLLISELGCEAGYLVARDGGEIRGVLPVMWSGEAGSRVCNSLPLHGNHGGPVAVDVGAADALIAAWNERALDGSTLASTMIENPFLELPAPEPLHELTDGRFTQFVLLPAGAEDRDVMKLISAEARNNVRRAARRGVTVELDNDALASVHLIHEETMARFGAPPKTWRFFGAILSELRAGEDFDIWIARVEGELAAALLVIRFNGVSEYFASGTREGFRENNPHPALVFTALAHEARGGARIWNWGGTRDGMDGVFHFKSKWGSLAGRYRYFVHVNDDSLLDSTPEELQASFPGFYVLPFAALRSRAA